MSSFSCPVVRVTIEPHPNADAIELAHVGGYVSIVKKGQFKTGDLAVYIPEDAVLPEWLLVEMGFWDDINCKGMLSNAAGNRVRAVKLRGIVSQGLLFAGEMYSESGDKWLFTHPEHEGNQGAGIHQLDDEMSENLGIVKYEVAVPAHLSGRVAGGDLEACFLYDFENIKARPNIFNDDDQIVITEKLHGTQFQCGLVPESVWAGKAWAEKSPLIGTYRGVVTSKGLSKQGLLLDSNDLTNVYVKTAHKWDLWNVLLKMAKQQWLSPEEGIYIFGEIYGAGLQKGYNYDHGVEASLRVFDIAAGKRNDHHFMSHQLFQIAAVDHGLPTVPVLYDGPYNRSVVTELSKGQTTLGAGHIREGVVVKCADEVYDKRYGRRIVKSINDAYLLQKGNTEYQ